MLYLCFVFLYEFVFVELFFIKYTFNKYGLLTVFGPYQIARDFVVLSDCKYRQI